MKTSAVYLKAAKIIDMSLESDGRHDACCWALTIAYEDSTSRQDHIIHTGFATAFKPEDNPIWWFGARSWGYPSRKEYNKLVRNKEHRVYAMLFMHELAKDAGL